MALAPPGPDSSNLTAPFKATFFFTALLAHWPVSGLGKEQWIKEANDHPLTTITGSISIYGDDIFIPLSSVEIVTAIENDYECCTFRGGLVAMNKKTGD